ncbi:putative Ig domain-containing protein [Agrobacterium fabrum]|uniref:putative Ig domain-containing protein n=1 Tax=Agrobacterium fabrum TaxID=1176649 RepID=UPI000B86FC73|nr:putative Ig domain-containing protein [Agrobacterium fabrum]
MGGRCGWLDGAARCAASGFRAIRKTAPFALMLLVASATAGLAQSVSVSASPSTFNAEGDVIRFDYVIDPGSYTIRSINPTSTSIKGASVSCPSVGGGLEYPNRLTCTATYPVDSLDVMSGQFSDFASFTGTRIGGSFNITSNTVVVRAAAGGPVIISVTSSPSPSQPGEEVAITATVSSMGCNAGQSPPGNVTISIGSQSTNLGLSPTGPVSTASSATFRTSSLASGTYPISASYSGGSGCSTGSASGTDHTVETKPTVTINQAASQADPTSRSPILFDVVFDKPITGFSSSDVQLSGTAGATSVAITGSGPNYSIAVSGMSQAGTVTATIPGGRVATPAGLANEASTSTDNTVTYDPIKITPVTLSTPVYNQPYGPITLTAAGGAGPHNFAVSAGSLPTGLSLTSSGDLSGTATQSGTFAFTVTATDSAGSTGPQSYTLAIAAPVIEINPTSLPAATYDVGYNQTLTASGGALPLVFSVTTGSLPHGLTLSTSGVLSGTPIVAENTSFTITSTDANGETGSRAYSIEVTPTIPDAPTGISATAGDMQAAVSFQPPQRTGGAYITSYTVTTSPPDILPVTGPSSPIIVNGLTNGQSYTFTVTAENSVGSGSPSTASNSVTPRATQTITFPNPGTQTFGTTPTLSATSDSGLTPVFTSSTTTVCTVTTTGLLAFVSTGTCTINADQPGNDDYLPATQVSRSFPVNPAAPIANNVSVTILPDSASNVLPLDVTGGAATAVTVATAPTHGTANANGTTISYTPAQGYSGQDSFTYTATNVSGTSAPATVNIQVTATTLVFSPAPGRLADAFTAVPYHETISISGGRAPYQYSISGTLPNGLNFNTATGEITGTATAPGVSSFSVTARDADNVTASAVYNIAVLAPAPVATDGAVTVAADSSGNPVPLNLSGGQADTIIVVAGPSHGTATVTGVALTYSPAGGYSGPDSITYTASNSTGSSTATITVTVTPPPGALSLSPAGGALKDAMAGEAYSQAITATGGTTPLIYSLAGGTLPRGMVLNLSTGELTGPLETEAEGDYSFTVQVRDARGSTISAGYTLKVTAREVSVKDKEISVAPGATPPNVNLAAGATGGPFTAADLTFVSPSNAGRASIVNGEFAQAGGPQTTGFYLKFIPNPAFSGQVKVGFRLTSALGSSNQGTITYKLGYDAARVVDEINDLVHGFISARQNLIASTIKVPGLLERRQMANATEAVASTATPSGEGMVLGFSTSLAQIEAARNRADGAVESELPAFNIWLDGTFLVHNREDSGSKWGSFAMVSAGVDYLLSDKALVGFSFHLDRMTDPTDGDNELTGNGWLVGPNASLEIAKGIFWNSSLLYGGSANDIDTPFWDGSFDTTRWLFDTSISGRWDLDDVTTFIPKLRGVYFSETVEDYAVGNSAGDSIDLQGFREEQLRVSLGAEVARQIALENGSIVTPKIGGTVGVSGLDGSGAFGALTTGVTMETVENWSLDAALLFNIEAGGETSAGAKLGVSKKF